MIHTVDTYAVPYSRANRLKLPKPITRTMETGDLAPIVAQLPPATARSEYDQQHCYNDSDQQVQFMIVIRPPLPTDPA